MIEVKRVEYDRADCSANNEPACPYCGHLNETTELRVEDCVTEITECDSCGKTFSYKPTISFSFETMPYENHYLNERKWQEVQKKLCESVLIKSSWSESQIKKHAEEIERLDKEADEILGEQP